jgi:hypothetical protein
MVLVCPAEHHLMRRLSNNVGKLTRSGRPERFASSSC